MRQGLQKPVLAHIHVPKCAGTSFRRALDEIFPNGHLHLYFEPGTQHSLPTGFVYPNEQIGRFIEADEVGAFSLHFVRRFPAALAERQIYYVTFLRQPVEQFLSYLSFTRRVFGHILDPDLLSHLPPRMPELSLRECAEWLLGQDTKKFLNFRENYTTNFFARYEVQAKYGFSYSDVAYRMIRLQVTRNALRRFFFVGIAEQMDDSWRLLRNKLEGTGIQLPALSIGRENRSEYETKDRSWLNEDDEIGRQVLISLREDLRLYRWACRRFDRQLAKKL